MRQFLIYFLLLLCYSVNAGYNLSGNVTDYITKSAIESCKVHLIGLSPNTANSEQYTHIDGTYLFSDITEGVYKITVSHKDYAIDSAQIIISGEMSHSFALLALSHLLRDGFIPDTFVQSNSPYLINDDLSIANTIYINPGVEIIIVGKRTIYLKGNIFAIGDQSDSIVFTADYPGNDTDSLEGHGPNIFFANNDSVCVFRYCSFQNLRGLEVYSANVPKMITFENCAFQKMENVLISTVVSIRNFNFNKNIVLNCANGIHDLNYHDIGDTHSITDNLISCSNEALLLYINNGFILKRNTIVGNSRLNFSSSSALDTVSGNIFNSLVFLGNSSTTPFLAYNDIISHSGEKPFGVGDFATINALGDSCDFFYNISKDPLISDSTTGALYCNSPCIGAGFNGENIGVYQGICSNIQYLPFAAKKNGREFFVHLTKNGLITVKLPHYFLGNSRRNIYKLMLFNSNGETLYSQTASGREYSGTKGLSFCADANQLPSGYYLLSVTNSDFSLSTGIVLME